MNANGKIDLFSGFSLDLGRGSVMRSTEPVHLRPQTYQVLKYLAENRGVLISKDKLIEEVWKGRAVSDGSLGKCIEEVREALGPQARKFIRNVHGRGYIFDVVSNEPTDTNRFARTEQVEVVAVTVEEQEESDNNVAADALAQPRPRLINKRTVIAAISTVAALFVCAALVYRFLGNRTVNAVPITSIAVLPLINSAGTSETDYLSDGITESLINNLSQLPNLKVMSRNSVFRYKDQQVDAERVAKALNVQAVLTGRVTQRGNEIGISVELVDARDNRHVWGEHYNRRMSDLVALQSEIARDVSQKLQAKLSSAEEQKLTKNYSENAEVYQLYLKGRYHVLKGAPTEAQKGVAYFQQAIAIDRSYAPAYVGLANALRVLVLTGDAPSAELFSRSKDAAQKAIEIDDTFGEAHASLGFTTFWYDWNWTIAEKEFQRALELNPNDPSAYLGYAHLHSNLGNHDQAIALIDRAIAIDPLWLLANSLKSQFLFYGGRYDEAIAQANKTLELEPNFFQPHLVLSWAYFQKGLLEQAIAEGNKAKDVSGGNSSAVVAVAYALVESGRKTEGRALLENLKRRSVERHVPSYACAGIHNALGEREEAIAWLERAYREREARLVFLKIDPKWNNLRDDARFADLMGRVGF